MAFFDTGLFYPSSNPLGFVTGNTGVLFGVFAPRSETGQFLTNPGVSMINLLSGGVTLTGVGNVVVTTGAGNTVFVSGVTGNLTGLFYPRFSNPLNYLSGLTQTGSLTGSFYPLTGNPSGFLTPSSTGSFPTIFALKSETGQFITNAGVTFLNLMSGSLTLTGAGNVTVATGTGNFITVSGNTGQSYPLFGNPSNFATSGNLLTASGNLSGALDTRLLATGAYLASLVGAAGVSSVNGINGAVLVTGLGNVTVTMSGSVVRVSGAAGGGGSSFAWSYVTGNITGAASNGYIFNQNSGVITFGLPLAYSLGDHIKLVGRGLGVSGLWKVSQRAENIIYFGNSNTTSGVSGYLQSTHPRNCVDLIQVNSGEWEVISSIGNIEVI